MDHRSRLVKLLPNFFAIRRRPLATLALAALGLTVAGCNLSEPELFDPAKIQQYERDGAANSSTYFLRPLPTTREGAYGNEDATGPAPMPTPTDAHRPTTGPDLDHDPIVRMGLREIIHRAVANNYDVRVAGYQPAIEGTRVIEAEGNFDPIFFTNGSFAHKDDVTGGQIFNSFNGGGLVTSNINKADQGTFQTGFQQNLDNGAQLQLQFQNQYSRFNPQQTTLNPFYESDLTLQLTQPLLRNFGYDVNHARIVINRINQKVSLLEFRKAVETNAANIEKAYWQLVQAERDIHILQDLIGQTEGTFNILNTRMKHNLDVSELQVAQTQTRLESRRAELLQFKSQARDLSDQIKSLMSDPEYPISGNVVILPADAPVEEPMEFNLDDQMKTAMENRFELGEQQLKVDAADVTVGVAKNNLLPQLDFIGSVGAVGGAGNLGDAWHSNSDFNHFDYSAGFKLQIPLGNRAARAIWQRTLLERLQSIAAYRGAVETVAVDVKTSARAVSTAYDTIVQTRRARIQAQVALDAINDRENANEPLTPVFVQLKLDTQETLSQSQQAEAQAISAYNNSLAQLERSKGTLLRYNNVLLEEEPAKAATSGLLH